MNPLRHPYRWSIALVVLFILVGISLPGGGIQEKGCETLSLAYMKQIALAVELYQSDNAGKLPTRLSQLLPVYITSYNIFYMRCGKFANVRPPNEDPNPKLIDLFSAYDLALLSDGRAVIFERMHMWSDGKMSYCVTVKGTETPDNSQTGHVPPAEFSTRYLHDFKP